MQTDKLLLLLGTPAEFYKAIYTYMYVCTCICMHECVGPVLIHQ